MSYDDIIHMTYKKSSRRPRMSQSDRAAQFAPFAALTGHKEQVQESQRITEKKRLIDENRQMLLDQKLQAIIIKQSVISVEYFVRDAMKDGGAYLIKTGRLKKIDEYQRVLVFEDLDIIDIDDIYEIEIA